MNIRSFRKGDETAVSDLISRTLKQCNSRDYPAEFIDENIRSHSPEVIRNRAAESHFYVACEGDTVIGCGGITGYWGSTTESYVVSVFVDAAYQRRGIGRRIMETLEHDEYFLRARRTELGASLTAVEFYRHLGYSFKNGIQTPDEFGVVRMEKIMIPKSEYVRISPCGDDCMKCPRFTAKNDDEL